MKETINSELDESLFLWFIQQRSQGLPLTGPLLKEKALYFNNILRGDPKFKASEGWLSKFKVRHGIRQFSIEGEKLSADSSSVLDFKEKLRLEIMKYGLKRDQVFN